MIIDIFVLAVLLISALIAFLRGFIREALTIMGVAGGLVAAYFGGPAVVPHMRGWFGLKEGEEPGQFLDVVPYDILANILSYGLVFIFVVIALSIASHFLAEGARNLGLGAIDRTLGFIFGLARGVLVLGLFYLPVHFYGQDSLEPWFSGSKTHFYLEKVAVALSGLIPSSAIEGVEKSIDEASETRRKLEEINLLKKEGEEEANGKPVGDDTARQGYTEEFRQKMDELFREKTDNPDGGPPQAGSEKR